MNSLRKSLSDYDRSTAFDLYTNGMIPIQARYSMFFTRTTPRLRASTCGFELTLHTVISVNIDHLRVLDRKISPLAHPFHALEFLKILISNECPALNCGFFVLILLSF